MGMVRLDVLATATDPRAAWSAVGAKLGQGRAKVPQCTANSVSNETDARRGLRSGGDRRIFHLGYARREVNIHGVRRSIPYVCLALALFMCGCRESARVSEILRVAPGVPQEVAWHLVHDSDSKFRVYAVRSGTQDLRRAVGGFDELVPQDPEAAYDVAYRQVRPYWARTTR